MCKSWLASAILVTTIRTSMSEWLQIAVHPLMCDVPVVVTKVSSRDLRLSFCHIDAEKFWEEHDLLDPKLGNPPAMEGGNDPSKFLPVVLCGDGAQA